MWSQVGEPREGRGLRQDGYQRGTWLWFQFYATTPNIDSSYEFVGFLGTPVVISSEPRSWPIGYSC